MSWIAGVIVNMPVDSVDKIFDYVVTDDLENSVGIGSRVLIPFKSNITDGFIMERKSTPSKPVVLKNIIDSVDDINYFDSGDFELIKYIRNKYVCRYIDAIKCFIPPEADINVRKRVVVCDNLDLKDFTDRESNLLEIITAGRSIVYTDNLGKDKNVMYKLRRKGAVYFIPDVNRGMKHKKLRMVRLKSFDGQTADSLSEREKDFIELLKNKDWVLASELVKMKGIDYGFIKRLYKKKLIDYEYREVRRKVEFPDLKEKETSLNSYQLRAVDSYIKAKSRGINKFLLYGVPNSGKTDVYMKIVQDVLSVGKSVLILVPDIFLTPQLIGRFTNRFGDNVAVFHSKLPAGQHFDEWDRIRRGGAKIVIGTRSAVFSPMKNLGLVVIDEEQDKGFKQSDMYPFYDSRDVAEKRCELTNASLILCSSTPSVETYYRAESGEIELLTIPERVNKFNAPHCTVVDLRRELKSGNRGILSRRLISELERCLKHGEQAILFLNKRGYSGCVMCQNCGYIYKCPRCDITLSYHADKKVLTCHYCNYTKHVDHNCPKCGAKGLVFRGFGTQRLEKEINRIFPEARVLRIDSDTLKSLKSINKSYTDFREGKADILIGTQIITKGLNFPNVTLAAVILADIGLNLPDFRSDESIFQIITQLCGISGRNNKRGNVLVQTFSPDNHSIQYAANNDYAGFYRREISLRERFKYPPFVCLCRILCTGLNDEAVRKAIALWYNDIVENISRNKINGVKLLHPVPCSVPKIKEFYRWQIIIKGEDEEMLTRLVTDSYKNVNRIQGIKYIIDINPFSMK